MCLYMLMRLVLSRQRIYNGSLSLCSDSAWSLGDGRGDPICLAWHVLLRRVIGAKREAQAATNLHLPAK